MNKGTKLKRGAHGEPPAKVIRAWNLFTTIFFAFALE